MTMSERKVRLRRGGGGVFAAGLRGPPGGRAVGGRPPGGRAGGAADGAGAMPVAGLGGPAAGGALGIGSSAGAPGVIGVLCATMSVPRSFLQGHARTFGLGPLLAFLEPAVQRDHRDGEGEGPGDQATVSEETGTSEIAVMGPLANQK